MGAPWLSSHKDNWHPDPWGKARLAGIAQITWAFPALTLRKGHDTETALASLFPAALVDFKTRERGDLLQGSAKIFAPHSVTRGLCPSLCFIAHVAALILLHDSKAGMQKSPLCASRQVKDKSLTARLDISSPLTLKYSAINQHPFHGSHVDCCHFGADLAQHYLLLNFRCTEKTALSRDLVPKKTPKELNTNSKCS